MGQTVNKTREKLLEDQRNWLEAFNPSKSIYEQRQITTIAQSFFHWSLSTGVSFYLKKHKKEMCHRHRAVEDPKCSYYYYLDYDKKMCCDSI